MIEKVTLFVTRQIAGERDLLILIHPFAGNQLPSGTIEEGEPPGQAARREAWEETGLGSLENWQLVGEEEETLSEGVAVLQKSAIAYARPDKKSFDWIRLPRAVQVEVLRQEKGFSQVRYVEPDQWPGATYESMIAQGWVLNQMLTNRRKRYFFMAECFQDTGQTWKTFTDHHQFTLSWVKLNDPPQLNPPFSDYLHKYGPGRKY